jgi:putative ABC transport system ATP-binding protein
MNLNIPITLFAMGDFQGGESRFSPLNASADLLRAPHQNTAAIHVKQVNKSVAIPHGNLNILMDINISVKLGTSVAIVGESGSGKSTLLALMAGLDTPTSGEVILLGKDLTTLTEDQRAQLRAKRVGFVWQAFNLVPYLTALENVLLPLSLSKEPQAQERAEHWLAAVGLSARATHYPKQLSGGEQQRVAIARAFATQPELVFADEPTGNLDQRTGTLISELMWEMNAKQNTTLVLVTHDIKLAEHCQRQIHLQSGQVVEQ